MTKKKTDHDDLAAPSTNSHRPSSVQAGQVLPKRGEDALRVSLEKYQVLFESFPLGITISDKSGRIIEANRQSEQLLGIPRETHAQRRIDSKEWRIIRNDGTPMPADEYASTRALRENRLIENVEMGIVKDEGEITWISVTAAPIPLEGYGVAITYNDITGRKQAEGKIALNSQRMQTLLKLNQMTEATLKEITDFVLEEAVRLTQSKLGYLAFLNEDESVLTMHSWSKSAMAECAINEKPIIYPVASTGLLGEAVRQRRPVITNDYTAANPLKKGYPQGHVAVKSHMNVPVFVGSRIVIVAGVGNKAEEYVQEDVEQLTLLMEGMWRLIERKTAEQQLQAEKTNLDALFESSPVAMFVVDETTNIVMTNQAFTVICGGSEADILQHRPGNALRCVHSHKDPRGCGYAAECKFCNVRNGVEGLITNGGSLHGAELELELTRNEEPSKYWMNIGVEPFVMNGRKRWCIAMDDITERKRAEKEWRQKVEELRASNDTLEQFNRAAVGRELRMIELKQELNELCKQAGLPPRYPLHSATESEKTDSNTPPTKPGQS